MAEQDPTYLMKAVESLEGALAEYANRRYHNSANRSYYACFHAAVHALLQEGFSAPPSSMTWSHKGVQSEFVNQLIQRRKTFPSDLRSVLQRNYTLRQAADYSSDVISAVQAERALRRARTFVQAIEERGGAQ